MAPSYLTPLCAARGSSTAEFAVITASDLGLPCLHPVRSPASLRMASRSRPQSRTFSRTFAPFLR